MADFDISYISSVFSIHSNQDTVLKKNILEGFRAKLDEEEAYFYDRGMILQIIGYKLKNQKQIQDFDSFWYSLKVELKTRLFFMFKLHCKGVKEWNRCLERDMLWLLDLK